MKFTNKDSPVFLKHYLLSTLSYHQWRAGGVCWLECTCGVTVFGQRLAVTMPGAPEPLLTTVSLYPTYYLLYPQVPLSTLSHPAAAAVAHGRKPNRIPDHNTTHK